MQYISSEVDNSARRLSYISTGIPGFDSILGGGLPANRLYLVQGLAGCGKTTLACQIGFNHAKQGKKVLVLTLIAESHAKLLDHLSNFSFFDESLLGIQLQFLGGYSALSKGGLRELLTLITATISKYGAEILIIDGFRAARQGGGDDIGLSEFMHSLNSLTSTMGCTTFLLSPVQGNTPESENTLVDGLIELGYHERGMRVIRELQVYKIRGGDHLLGKHVFEVTKDGIVTYPRFEAAVTRSIKTIPVSDEPVAFGIPSWDKLIGDGLKRGSTTNLLGSPGVGKTLMGLHFIHNGLANGENCLVLGFYESPPRLIEKANNVGLDLQRHVNNGSLEFIWHPPLEVLVDGLIKNLFENIEERNVTRLLIDGIDGLREIFIYNERVRSFLIALVNELRSRGITTFFTQELPYFKESFGPAENSASILFENIILMNYVELNDAKYRQMSVLKLRESGCDMANYVMHISDNGIYVDGKTADLRKTLALQTREAGGNSK